jgi:DNA mismatch repair protein MutS
MVKKCSKLKCNKIVESDLSKFCPEHQSLYEKYFDFQLKYEKKYGNNVVVAMQVGAFYEIYQVLNNINPNDPYSGTIGKAKEISGLLDIRLTRKNKNIEEISIKNPLMCGVPEYAWDTYKDRILKFGWKIVKILQEEIDTDTVKKIFKREPTEIISPGVNFTPESTDSNYLMSIYLEDLIPTKKSQSKQNFYIEDGLYMAGVCLIDVSTGESMIFSVQSNKDDTRLAIDDIFRLIQTYKPREILLNANELKIDKDLLLLELDLHRYGNNLQLKWNEVNKEYFKINYQNTFLKKIFPETGFLSPAEYLDIELYPNCIISFILMIQYVYDYNENMLNNIKKPIFNPNNKHLTLHNNAINQLNLIDNYSLDYYGQFNSLFSVINKTITVMGKRELRRRLINPIVDEKTLNSRYDCIEELQIDNKYIQFEQILHGIIDTERLHRRFTLNKLGPSDLYNLNECYERVLKIDETLKSKANSVLKTLELTDNVYKGLKDFMDEYKSKFEIEDMKTYTRLSTFDKSFLKKNINGEIDKIQNEIDKSLNYFENMVKELSKIIEPNKFNKGEYVVKYDKINTGYFITLTNIRWNILKSVLSKKNPKLLNDLKPESLPKKKDIRLYSNDIKNHSNNIFSNQEYLNENVKEIYKNIINELNVKWHWLFDSIDNFISNLDCLNSNAKVSILYNYTKPIIQKLHDNDNDNNRSYIDTEGLRHPIVERIQTNTEYIDNDITIGKNPDLYGMLLFGVNACGKSTNMKAIGINIILAQAGCYVAAKRFIYNPFHHIITRISSNDNMLMGHSSFVVEMLELRAMIKRSGCNTFVLGDEICNGTEHISGLSIVAAALKFLSDSGTNFIFATHLHFLNKIKIVTDLPNVKFFHLQVNIDETQKHRNRKRIIYNRKIKEGPGSSIYGIEVARSIDLGDDLLKLAEMIRKDLMGINDEIVPIKKSKYNSFLYMIECEICKKSLKDADELHTHHLKEQCTADSNGMINKKYHKNSKFNLVSLCKDCHMCVHGKGSKNIVIDGYVQTSDGIILKYVEN